MLTYTNKDTVDDYIRLASPDMQQGLRDILAIMGQIAPSAKLVCDPGIPFFQENTGWVYGVAARHDHYCVYFSDPDISPDFYQRLPQVQFGEGCLIIHRLEEVNINVLAELLGQIKVHFTMHEKERAPLLQ
ncbi:DUF1801 domain-containing protein [Marinomonas epiphytica]